MLTFVVEVKKGNLMHVTDTFTVDNSLECDWSKSTGKTFVANIFRTHSQYISLSGLG